MKTRTLGWICTVIICAILLSRFLPAEYQVHTWLGLSQERADFWRMFEMFPFLFVALECRRQELLGETVFKFHSIANNAKFRWSR